MNATEKVAEQVEERAQAWIATSFSDPHGDWQSRFSAENMEAAFAAGFAAATKAHAFTAKH